MKWTTQHGKVIEISDMDDNHARNCINMLVRNNSPQAVLFLICEANEARKQKLKEKSQYPFELNGDMAEQFNETYARDEQDYLERQMQEDYWYKKGF